MIFKNTANTLLLILSELIDSKNYSSVDSFIHIFTYEHRLIYLGLFFIFISLYFTIFIKKKKIIKYF